MLQGAKARYRIFKYLACIRRNHAFVLCALLCIALLMLARGHAQPADPVKWWPSEWGPEDQRGAANRMTPQKVLEATRLINKGKVYRVRADRTWTMVTQR